MTPKNAARQTGQTLIILIFIMVVSISVISTAVLVLIVNSRSTSEMEEGMKAYYVAESGIENAILRTLRDPNYSSDVIDVDGGTASITVTGTDPKTIQSVGKEGTYTKKIEVVISYTNNILTILSRDEY